ncbi:DUF3347 domain-containing protein [Sphingobacterium suaedae]|uniref:DUF3347 domain-containing protein n=1 Tax=Sphingobacterium suaedae TaxID=1686402 RepID=A0ABW5KEH5_9SPHI
MKNITVSMIAVIMVSIAVSCNQASNKNQRSSNDTAAVSAEGLSTLAREKDSVAVPTVNETSSGSDAKAEKKETQNFSIAPIVADYLSLKNALVSDDDKAAASAAKKLLATWNKIDMKAIPTDKQNEYIEIADDAKEQAEHIGENAGNMEHQREHLVALSEDLKDLINLFGSSQTLYQDHCPMFDDGKGAVWFSESKEIKNPYYGSKMMNCGKVEKTIHNNIR